MSGPLALRSCTKLRLFRKPIGKLPQQLQVFLAESTVGRGVAETLNVFGHLGFFAPPGVRDKVLRLVHRAGREPKRSLDPASGGVPDVPAAVRSAVQYLAHVARPFADPVCQFLLRFEPTGDDAQVDPANVEDVHLGEVAPVLLLSEKVCVTESIQVLAGKVIAEKATRQRGTN